MEIRRYTRNDEDSLMRVIEAEGEDWKCYWGADASHRYRERLADSITYVAYDGETLCGYSRSMNDGDFYIFVLDLLVAKEFRGRSIGRELMKCVRTDYPGREVFVLSDVDEYYVKQGYQREGSIFKVT